MDSASYFEPKSGRIPYFRIDAGFEYSTQVTYEIRIHIYQSLDPPWIRPGSNPFAFLLMNGCDEL